MVCCPLFPPFFLCVFVHLFVCFLIFFCVSFFSRLLFGHTSILPSVPPPSPSFMHEQRSTAGHAHVRLFFFVLPAGRSRVVILHHPTPPPRQVFPPPCPRQYRAPTFSFLSQAFARRCKGMGHVPPQTTPTFCMRSIFNIHRLVISAYSKQRGPRPMVVVRCGLACCFTSVCYGRFLGELLFFLGFPP